MKRVYWGEVKDPVYGYIYITEHEKTIIDSYPVQRLRRLRQLAGAEYVYPGANHTRFEHSVGVMYLSSRVIENPSISRLVDEEEAEMVKIAALLHDVGHGPFSHVFEQLSIKKLGKTHEDFTAWIVRKSELKDEISRLGYNAEEIADLAVGRMKNVDKAFLNQIISSSIDVDKMDFVVRDTYHTGAGYGFVDVFRIIHMLGVLGGSLAVDMSALSALESFIIARIESFKSIYFHRVGRAAQIMLAMALEKANEELGLTDFKTPEEYLAMDDYTVWAMLKKCSKSRPIIQNLERRKMLKCAYEQTFYVRDKTVTNIFSAEEFREQLRDRIAKKANVDPEDVVIDVPTVPSVPYHPSMLTDPMEIPVFRKTQDGKKELQRLSDISGIFEVLKGFINILRVYTDESLREKVGEAALDVLGEIPFSAKISY
ncbi:MAG: HD domain-containing protein [Nitrososphaerota archaeon]|nr:HD domain-containing protein [Candidatus Bathyarchaeota archaeon]MDW8194505.1 HD domain-containing protein [Nitrososphaerota archaeon]